ncbi:heparin lyase I family protein [Photobacterium damselae]|uniref:heparin lyase I family protein n=1 Tax=Photobacterium damselae TaxID=38293 RepID=UPI0040696431
MNNKLLVIFKCLIISTNIQADVIYDENKELCLGPINNNITSEFSMVNCNNSMSQKFIFNGKQFLSAVDALSCLTVVNEFGVEKLVLKKCDSTDKRQYFSVESRGLRSKWNNQCLTYLNNYMTTTSCKGEHNQKFSFSKTCSISHESSYYNNEPFCFAKYIYKNKPYMLRWESGKVSDNLIMPLDVSYSTSSTDITTAPTDYHNINILDTDNARQGHRVIDFFAKPPSIRSELAFMALPYRYSVGDDFFYTSSIKPDSSWINGKYSTIISQWKSFGSKPHAMLRLSNDGKYELFFQGVELDLNSLGTIKPNNWTDIRVYFKKSLGDDGVVKIWINGVLKLERYGQNMLSDRDGYTKFGMYTEIYGERHIQFDNVSVAKKINEPINWWGNKPVTGWENNW